MGSFWAAAHRGCRAGPGLATSVYAASEGLSVLVLDCRSFGGQAGDPARIEGSTKTPAVGLISTQVPPRCPTSRPLQLI